ncbi:hypothetical protein EWM64_g8602 [Hericium alpestre]|uniref:Uncharacterized protein n=1 Tax=Hericium alpestre TaxID=135208 RepID=A0A4Y9ZPP8_9AGAM|nr:hypothetical protein EWM64_g8602 [Hericium alpestre]
MDRNYLRSLTGLVDSDQFSVLTRSTVLPSDATQLLAPGDNIQDGQPEQGPSDAAPEYAASPIPSTGWTSPPSRPVTTSQPLTYTFSPLSFNSMLLLPPPDASDTRPKYHISVILNCFMPASFITTVRRGASETGKVVGEIEMGDSMERATYTIGGMQEREPDTSYSWDSWRFHNVHWKIVKTESKPSARVSASSPHPPSSSDTHAS